MKRYFGNLIHNRRTRSTVTLLILIGLLVSGWRGNSMQTATARSPFNNVSAQIIEGDVQPGNGTPNNNGGLQITLSEGSEQPTTVEPVETAPAEPLSAPEAQTILDRLPALAVETGDQQELRLPTEILPPPRPGTTITETFPLTDAGPATTAAVTDGPLEVLRFAPEGDIPIAPFLSVTFNQPMVPLTTLAKLSATDVPVKITPTLPGVWKWLGTKTLIFEYKSDEIDRFPKATEYTVEIPAGTTSAKGNALAEAVTWTFRTPPPKLAYTYPSYGPQPLAPLLFVSFDQRIDPAAVLETIQVTASGEVYTLHLASDEEIAADTNGSRLVKQVLEGRGLAFQADREFPAGTTVTVNIGPNTPSAEGPLTTSQVQSYSFTTYAPLRIDEHGCGWGDQECPPFSPFFIRFNNPLDASKFDPALLTIEPAIAGVTIEAIGNSLEIRGATQGRTTYAVTVPGETTDIFGQTLGEAQTLTFKTGPATAFLTGPNNNLVTLDPSSSQPNFTIYSVNYEKVRVRVFAVTPTDWPAYQTYLREDARQENPIDPPGRKVLEEVVPIEAVADELVETNIDLRAALGGPVGHLIVIVDVPNSLLSSSLVRLPFNQRDRTPTILTWVQVTQIGLDAFSDHSEMVAWATNLRDGAPLGQVAVSLLNSDRAATTDATGIARFALPDQPAPVLIGQIGDDVAMLPQSNYYWNDGGWIRNTVSDELRWYVFDDRQMYRPSEEVQVKGWLRRIGAKQTGDVSLLGNSGVSIQYTVNDPQGNQLADGVIDVNELGGFDFAFTLPENANLGYANIYLSARNVTDVYNTDYYHNFQIQEFRRPEFEVVARNEEKGPFFVGDDAVVAISAQYYAGGPLPGAETTWNVSSSPSSYAPPNWPDFVFGTWTPWWGFYDSGASYGNAGSGSNYQSYTNKTDAAGVHYLRMNFDSVVPENATPRPRPYSVVAEGVVMDVNRQAWSATTSLLVHPADRYVGIRSDRTFVEQGEPLVIEAIVTDLDGNAFADYLIDITAARMEWKYSQGQWREEAADTQTCTIASAMEPVSCEFTTDIGGSYRIAATVWDDKERLNQSEFTRWVSGGKRPAARNVEQEQVTLIPDQESYQPGDVAEILVQSPFSPAEALLTVSRSGLISLERFTIEDGTYTIKIPIEEAHIPNLNIQVDLTGAAPRLDDKGEAIANVPSRPAYATGYLTLAIPPVSRTLALSVVPASTELAPGVETSVAVSLTNAAGEPVADAELAIVVVDEAVLALTNYQLADPIAAFYSQRGSDMSSYYARASIVLANPLELANQAASAAQESLNLSSAARSMGMGGGEMMAAAPTMDASADMAYEESAAGNANANSQEQIALRTNFDPLAVFAPDVRTDANGQATLTFTLPDNLTRYRVMVIAVADGKYFGMGETNMTARLPLMVRPAAPRFLNFGDSFELPVVLQNQTDEPMEVDVALRTVNLSLPAGNGKRLTIPANDRVEVRFPAVTESAGTVRIQIAATAGEYADAATIELPVYTPATTEAFAVYGVVDEGAIAQPVASPQDVFPQFGGLEINTSSTALQALTDAVLYLTNYPFECSEQLASRILGVAALRDVLTAFEADGLPTPTEIEAAVQRDIVRLQALQNNDGGWPIWSRGEESVPYYTIHVAHALQMARLKDFAVPEAMMAQALDHLRNIENYYPSWYSARVRHTLSAYALYVRQLMGDVDTTKARNLLNSEPLDNQALDAIAWIWQVLSDDVASAQEVEAIRRHINNRAVETAGAANFTTSYGEDAYLLLHSSRRADAVILDALIQDQPDSDLIPKVVTGLLAHRTAGRWGNTQENAFVLLALDRYFNTFEAQTPDFVARIWLGETYAGEHTYVGRTTERHETQIPMSYLVDSGETQDLIVSKDGTGRLYYRLGLRYAPTDLDMPPVDMGFVVQRTYEAVDEADDVRRDDNGVWHIKAGARVRVRLSMVADNRRYHVALVDPLPAGLEAINPALAVSENVPADPANRTYGWWWWSSWYDHQNLRDERAEVFATLLWDGVYDYSYVARATTPGEFTVPPTKAEEMYSPEVFGRSASDRVIVE